MEVNFYFQHKNKSQFTQTHCICRCYSPHLELLYQEYLARYILWEVQFDFSEIEGNDFERFAACMLKRKNLELVSRQKTYDFFSLVHSAVGVRKWMELDKSPVNIGTNDILPVSYRDSVHLLRYFATCIKSKFLTASLLQESDQKIWPELVHLELNANLKSGKD